MVRMCNRTVPEESCSHGGQGEGAERREDNEQLCSKQQVQPHSIACS